MVVQFCIFPICRHIWKVLLFRTTYTMSFVGRRDNRGWDGIHIFKQLLQSNIPIQWMGGKEAPSLRTQSSHSSPELSLTPGPLHLRKEWCLPFFIKYFSTMSITMCFLLPLQSLQRQAMCFMRCSAYMAFLQRHKFLSRIATRIGSCKSRRGSESPMVVVWSNKVGFFYVLSNSATVPMCCVR